jgi:chemotaxis signal transduction protein
MTFGILANGVREASSLDPDDIRADLPTLRGIRAKYLKGVTRDGVVVLDGYKLLTDQKMVVDRTPGQ